MKKTYRAIAVAHVTDIFPGAILELNGGMYKLQSRHTDGDNTTLYVAPVTPGMHNPLLSTMLHNDLKLTTFVQM